MGYGTASYRYCRLPASRLAATAQIRLQLSQTLQRGSAIHDLRSNLLSWQKQYCACGRVTPRDSYSHKQYTEPFICTGNYKITMKSAEKNERNSFIEIC